MEVCSGDTADEGCLLFKTEEQPEGSFHRMLNAEPKKAYKRISQRLSCPARAVQSKQDSWRSRLAFGPEGDGGDTNRLQSGAAQDPAWRCKAWDEIDVMPKARQSFQSPMWQYGHVNRGSLTRTSAKKGIRDRRV